MNPPVTDPTNGKLYFVRWPMPSENLVEGLQSGHYVGYFIKVDDLHLRESFGFNKFSENLREIPAGSEFLEPMDRMLRFHLRDAVPDPEFEGALEQQVWKKSVHDECVTINNILALNPGDKLKVVVMDRNLEDVTTEINPSDEPVSGQEFFRSNWAIYTHESELGGRLEWSWAEGVEDDFQFEIEYKPSHWYPLQDGRLPEEDPQGFCNFGEAAGKHFSEFPGSNRIGWRGPMIAWDKLPNLPNVYWHDQVANHL